MRAVVVGAGIVGASAAYHLARRGVDVTVVDRAHPGKATLAGAGIVCPWTTSATEGRFVELYVDAAAAVAEVVAELRELGHDPPGYARVGAIHLAADDAELAACEARVASRTADGSAAGEVERLTGREAQDRFPPLRDDLPGLWIGGAARLDGRELAASLLRAAGAWPLAGEVALVADDDRVRGIELDGAPIEADAVVVAGGAWTQRLLRSHGVEVDVEPQKGQIVHLDLSGADGPVDTGTWPTILPPGDHYLVPFDDGRVVVGATRETGSGFDTRVTVAGQLEVLAAAVEWAPGLADAAVFETRVGLRPRAAGGLPTIGPVDDLPGAFVGTGMGAGGLTIGPLAGRLLADHVVGNGATR